MKNKWLVIGYFLPAVMGFLFYAILAVSGGIGAIHPLAWCFVALLFVSALLMLKNRWWGCVGGFMTGGVLIYMGTQYTGQIISETPIGIAFCVYYAVCGALCVYQTCRTGSSGTDDAESWSRKR